MDYTKFNDAMCRLRQAEEDLNRALRDVYVAINETERGPVYGGIEKDEDHES